MEKKFIHSSQLYVAVKPTVMLTILGSCVSVCLYDKKMQIAGINHYIMPLWNNQGLPSPKYGNIAIVKLIEAMEAAGCKKSNLIAKVFGGASPNNMNFSNENLMIGKRNIQVAFDILEEYKIKIVASDLGGDMGRKIYFHSQTGKVQMGYTKKQENNK